ncbi:MAG: hypothetical protein ACRC1R_01960 [Cetobacterium sp.]|uniref:hypothetical protein n=1 Tax=Cetobacterium sp. TaxID=2071632 RepID=UPI003F2D410F
MKELICAKDIEKILEDDKKEIEIEDGAIITAAAQDLIKNNEVQVVTKKNEKDMDMDLEKFINFFKMVSKDEKLQKKIKEILLNEKKFKMEEDASGLFLIRGESVKFDKIFESLNIYGQELIKNSEENIGMIKIIGDSFIKKVKSKGKIYVISGEIEMTMKGKNFLGKTGDIIHFPKNIDLRIGSKEEAKLLYFSKDLSWINE